MSTYPFVWTFCGEQEGNLDSKRGYDYTTRHLGKHGVLHAVIVLHGACVHLLNRKSTWTHQVPQKWSVQCTDKTLMVQHKLIFRGGKNRTVWFCLKIESFKSQIQCYMSLGHWNNFFPWKDWLLATQKEIGILFLHIWTRYHRDHN